MEVGTELGLQIWDTGSGFAQKILGSVTGGWRGKGGRVLLMLLTLVTQAWLSCQQQLQEPECESWVL